MISVAIDGPSGAGKSTLARRLAADLGYVYVDTGAMYRAIGLYASRQGADLHDEAAVAALLPQIRLDIRLVDGTQHVYLNGEDVLMDGRDIGTVVLPHATVKIFLTASPEARARRRCLELRQKGKDADYETVLADIRRRDEQDTNRPIAPLRQAEDAIRIDTSEIDFDQSFELLKRTIREHL